MKKTYTISLPGGFTRTSEILDIAQKVRQYDKDIVIQAYDTAQGLQWNGGRLIVNQAVAHLPIKRVPYDVSIGNLSKAIDRVKQLNDNGIPFNLTFNNVLENIDTDDEDGNYLLEQCHSGFNSVTVATRALTRHIRANFPNYKLTASICFVYNSIEECIRACELYDVVVMLPVFAYQPEELAKLPIEKLSFIINDDCFLFCRRKEHYESLSRCSLAGNFTAQEQQMNMRVGACFYREVPGYARKLPDGANPKLYAEISKKADAQECKDRSQLPGGHEFNITRATRLDLIQRGVQHFKFQGRAIPDDLYRKVVTDFVDAFVRDEL